MNNSMNAIYRNDLNVKYLTPAGSSSHILKTHFNKGIAFTKYVREMQVILNMMAQKSKRFAGVSNTFNDILKACEPAAPSEPKIKPPTKKSTIDISKLPQNSGYHLRRNTAASRIESDEVISKQPLSSSYNLRRKQVANRIESEIVQHISLSVDVVVRKPYHLRIRNKLS